MRFRTIGVAALIAATTVGCASAAKLSILYSFCRKVECTDGAEPHGIAMDRSGNLFGTTVEPESGTGESVVYELLASSSKWRERVLHNFCNQKSCRFYAPYSALTPDTTGKFFGITE